MHFPFSSPCFASDKKLEFMDFNTAIYSKKVGTYLAGKVKVFEFLMRWWLIYIVKLNYHRCHFQDYIRGVNPQSCVQHVEAITFLRSFKENP